MIHRMSCSTNTSARQRGTLRLAVASVRVPEVEPGVPATVMSDPRMAPPRRGKRTLDSLVQPTPGDTLTPAAEGQEAKRDIARLPVLAANLAIIAAGAAVSITPEIALHYRVFIGFLAGHVTWFGYAIRCRDRGLIALNAGLVLLDLYAIAIRL